jgi:signal transduction histidine kinase
MNLQGHSFLSIFEQDAVLRFVAAAQTLELGDGDVVFREGDVADALYLVLEGRVTLAAEASGHQEFLAECGADDFFGEFGVLDGLPRSAGATATGPVRLAKVPRQVLIDELGGSQNNASIRLMIQTIRKMRQSNQRHIDELLRREKMALLGQVVLSVVHDFRSPLSVILMATELIGSGDADEAVTKECSELIAEQVGRINAMAEEVLDYSRGKTSLRLEELELSGLLRHFVDLNERYMASRGVRLFLKSGHSCTIQGDAGRLQRVLQNLVYNAADAMGAAGGKIGIVVEKPGAKAVRILVRDNGPGIPEEVRDRVFEPFQTMGKKKGLGLGLAIARQFVEAHGGTLGFASLPGRGTAFAIRLPLAGR